MGAGRENPQGNGSYWSVTVGGQTGQREPGAQGTLGWGLGSGAAATDRKTTAH